MEKIVITEENVGPSLIIGRTEEELLAFAVAHITSAEWGNSDDPGVIAYDRGWTEALESLPKPKTVGELDQWVRDLHKDAELASLDAKTTKDWTPVSFDRHLADTSLPFGVYSVEEWEGDTSNDPIETIDVIDDCKHLFQLHEWGTKMVNHVYSLLVRMTNRSHCPLASNLPEELCDQIIEKVAVPLADILELHTGVDVDALL